MGAWLTTATASFAGSVVPLIFFAGVVWARVKSNHEDIRTLRRSKVDKEVCNERHGDIDGDPGDSGPAGPGG